jgi:SAM-dependent methyltransferase
MDPGAAWGVAGVVPVRAHLLSDSSSAARLEALLYDWHNRYRLAAQQHDVDFWAEQSRDSSTVLVLGAGTGRIATPLARAVAGTVVALDLSHERLQRIVPASGLLRICGDMRSVPIKALLETVVVPYSAFQMLRSACDREQAVRAAAQVLAPNGSLYIDVSTSFDSRDSSPRHLVMREPCRELGIEITEYECAHRERNWLRVEREFRAPNGKLVYATSESWTYFRQLRLEPLLVGAGLELLDVQSGYGAGRSPHRRIYWARRPASMTTASQRGRA